MLSFFFRQATMFHPDMYAGKVRIPPPTMQLRVRRETETHDTINARQFESWQASAGRKIWHDPLREPQRCWQ